MLKKILYATDLSKASEPAMLFAEDIAKRYSAHTIVLTVVPEEIPIEGIPLQEISDFWRKIMLDTEKRFDEFLKERFRNLKIEKLIARGRPYDEIVRISNEKDVDLIVIGTHGRTGIEHVILGSVAQRVLRRSSKPVLIVKSTK